MNIRILILLVFNMVAVNTLIKGQSVIGTDTAITTLKDGNWSDASIWSKLAVPGIHDSIVLSHNVAVDINAFCKTINLNGKSLTVNTGFKLTIDGVKPVINSQAKIIDTTQLKLISSKAELEGGIYRYQTLTTPPVFTAGNVILGIEQDGYLRKVTNVQNTPGEVLLTTEQGDMEDVFKQAKFGFGLSASGFQDVAGKPSGNKTANTQQVAGDEYSFSIAPRVLYANGPFSINLETANLSLQPNIKFDYDYGLSGLNSFSMTCDQAKLVGDVKIKIIAAGATSGSRTDTLKRAGLTRLVWVYGIPVQMKMDFFLISTLSFSMDAEVERSFTYHTDNSFTMGVEYLKDNGWNSTFNIGSTNSTVDLGTTSGKAKMTVGLALKPLFKVRFYSIVAPYIFLDIKQQITGRVQSPSLNWDLNYQGWAEPGIGLEVKMFGKRPATDFGPKAWSTDTFNYRLPHKILKVSGDFQTSTDTTAYLTKPIKVKVLDELNFSQANVPVYFKLKQYGKLSVDSILSDASGIAETQWKIDTSKLQTLEVSVKNGIGENINSSPLTFNASYGADTLKVIKIFNMANTPAFSTNFFKTIGVGKGDYIYAGSANNGFYKCIDTNWTKSTLLTNNNIADLKTDQFGGLWIAQYGNTGAQATTGGVGYLPDSTSTGYMYFGATVGSPTRNVRGIFIDTTRTNANQLPRIWTACMADLTAGVSKTGAIGLGLNAANPFFNKITLGIDVALQAGSIQTIGGDNTEVWAFASVNFGKSQILRYSAANNSLLGVFDYENTTVPGLTSNFSAKAIHFDTEGRRWVGLLTGGVLLHQNNTWQNLSLSNIFPAGMAVNQNAITQGQFGKIYFGTTTGLVIYNGGLITDEASYKRLTTANGLPSNNILDVIERQDGLLIVATDSGIAFMKK